MKLKLPRRRGQAGLTLIELMVAMTIGLLLLAGTASLFITNKRIYREQEELSRLQENARFALEMLIADIRMTGYAGCSDSLTTLSNWVEGGDDDTALVSFANRLEGSESSGNWAPSGSGESTGLMVAGTDAITVRYLDPTDINLTAEASAGAPLPIPAANINDFDAGELLAVSDCANSAVFALTDKVGNTLVHDDESEHGLANRDAAFDRDYDEDAEIMRFVARRYFICDGDSPPSNPVFWTCDQDSDGDPDDDPDVYNPTLFVVENDLDPRPLVDGVESMQILYGEDTTADQVADVYVAASAVGNWDNVVSVRVALLVRTTDDNPNNDVDTRSYDLLGTTFNPPDDRRRRRVFSTTIQVRNI